MRPQTTRSSASRTGGGAYVPGRTALSLVGKHITAGRSEQIRSLGLPSLPPTTLQARSFKTMSFPSNSFRPLSNGTYLLDRFFFRSLISRYTLHYCIYFPIYTCTSVFTCKRWYAIRTTRMHLHAWVHDRLFGYG